MAALEAETDEEAPEPAEESPAAHPGAGETPSADCSGAEATARAEGIMRGGLRDEDGPNGKPWEDEEEQLPPKDEEEAIPEDQLRPPEEEWRPSTRSKEATAKLF